jgi:hypothetical protein
MAIIAGAVTAGLLITGIAFAAQDATESTVNVSLAESQSVTLPVDDAGVVVLSRANGQLEIVTATANSGYSAAIEILTGREVEANFTGNGVKVEFNAELEDGVVKVRIRTEASDDSGSTSAGGVTSTTVQTSSTGSNSTTATTATSVVNGSGTMVLTDGQSSNVVVANAGSVLLRRNGDTLSIVSTESNPGWAVEVEVATGREVEGDFRNGSLRVTFNFELEDGVIKIKIESEGSTGTSGTTNTTDDNSSTSTTDDNGSTSTTDDDSSTSTTNTTGGSSLPTGSVTYDLDGAGTVTVNFANGGMTIGSVNPAAGWTVDKSDQSSDEIEVELVFGEAEVELNLHITGGQLVVQIIRS